MDIFGAGSSILRECVEKQSSGGFVRLRHGAGTVPVLQRWDAYLIEMTVVVLSTTDSANDRQAVATSLTSRLSRE